MEVQRIRLKKLRNARDLGGIPTADGRRIRPGKLIRAGRLHNLPEKTREALLEMGVTTVVDFRIAPEIEKHPDDLPSGVRYYNLQIFTAPDEIFVSEENMHKTSKREAKRIGTEFPTFDDYMVGCYKKILWSSETRTMLREFLRIVAEETGCLLFHCTSGKDRTGIAAMLLESLLGVREEDILTDYMVSRRFLRSLYMRYRVGIAVAPARFRTKRMVFGLLRLKKKYLHACLQSIREKCGTVEAYCRTVLGVPPEEITEIREKYLI